MRIHDMPVVSRLWILGLIVIFLAKLFDAAVPADYPVLSWSRFTLVAGWTAIVLVIGVVVGKSRPPRRED